MTNIREYLSEYGIITYRFKGVSMLPMLTEGKDVFTVVKKGKERCRKYDVVLFERKNGDLVLHRVVEVLPEGYVLLGDNCIDKESGIAEKQVLGVMTEFTHWGKRIQASNPVYRAYARVWYVFYPLRKFMKKLREHLKNM